MAPASPSATPARPVRALLVAAALVVPEAGPRAQALPTAAENLVPGGIDSEHLFGFVEGSDLGVPGEPELEWETTGRLGRRPGRFRAVDSGLALKVPLSADLRIAPGLSFNAYDIGPGDAPARLTGGVNGGFLEMRLRLLDRRAAPLGLTLSVTPSYGSVDGSTGLGAHSFGTEVGLLADRELIPDTLVAAVNVGYAFAATRPFGADARALASGFEVAGALAYQLRPGLFVGGEARYARACEGLGLDRPGGEAVYLGPTLYTTLSTRAWLSLAWNVQIAGGAVAEARALDLTNFDRHQVRLRVGYSF